MSSSHIKNLLQPPDLQSSHAKAKETINARFASIESLDDLQTLVLEFQQRHEELGGNVSAFQFFCPK
jgi:hypothetical protein